MCGICGFSWEDDKRIEAMTGQIKHRGPDREGYTITDGVSLGHARLSIIDLSPAGNQPMQDNDGTVSITFNGEIFNYMEIIKTLKKKYTLRSRSDTEVILYAYKEWGVKCLDRLNGQFAFCIHDRKQQVLFLARDRIGINPLYYHLDKRGLSFASELKALTIDDKKKQIHPDALLHYLTFGHTSSVQSIFKEYYKLAPGHFLTYNMQDQKMVIKRYWSIQQKPEYLSEAQTKKEIRRLLDESVRIRLLADVPVGAFLSGGFDSSTIVHLIKKYKKRLKTFSIQFDHDDFDESRYGKLVAKRFKTKHHVVKFSAKDVRKYLKKLAYHYDEPFGDASMIPTYLLSKVTREQVTVSLSGDGGDELFGGYNSYKLYRNLKIQRLYPQIINKIFHNLLKPFHHKLLRKPKAFFEMGCLPPNERYARLMSNVPQELLVRLLGRSPRKAYRQYARQGAVGELTTAIDHDLHNYLPDSILVKVDRASLAHGLESRPPFLDHRLVELSSQINPRLKLRGTVGKYILKEAFSNCLPQEIINRKKQGFGVPLIHYLQNELQDLVQSKVLNYKENRFFRKEGLKEITKLRDSTDVALTWRILMFNLWFEQWMDQTHQ